MVNVVWLNELDIYTHIDHPFKYYNKCLILNLILDCNFSFEYYVWCLGFFLYYFVSLWGTVILRCFIGTPSKTLFETTFWDRLGHFWITLGSWVISILCSWLTDDEDLDSKTPFTKNDKTIRMKLFAEKLQCLSWPPHWHSHDKMFETILTDVSVFLSIPFEMEEK